VSSGTATVGWRLLDRHSWRLAFLVATRASSAAFFADREGLAYAISERSLDAHCSCEVG